ncbi:Rossmann-fold NAD(P)-binding domain-containing protein [Chitinimonas naiadis]
MNILLTGVAGFIGLHTARALLRAGHTVVGIDNLNDYYAVSLKRARLTQLEPLDGFRFTQVDVADAAALEACFARDRFDAVIHLAAQAGVRHAANHPATYIQSNLVGFGHLLEACRQHAIGHLLYASSSSVYGGNTRLPYQESDDSDHPLSLYAASKKANEAMAHAYAHLHGLPCTGLRFFTVYGPWGRPDMAPWLFTEAILEGRPIRVHNHGQLRRDFTYIDDIVDSLIRLLPLAPVGEGDQPPWRILNVGNRESVPLLRMISTLEEVIGRPAVRELVEMQAGDVLATCANTDALEALTGFRPQTSLALGLGYFVDWYRHYRDGRSWKEQGPLTLK